MGFQIKGKAKKANPGAHSVRYLLHKHLVSERPPRPYHTVHASDLMSGQKNKDFCPREHALGMKFHNPKPHDDITTAMAVTFAYGYAVEDLIRGWFAEMDIAHGLWECPLCSHVTEFGRRPAKCPSCKASGALLSYKEVELVDPESGVMARPDLFLDFGRPRLTTIEIKSMDKEAFKKLVGPLAEHRWRTNLYMRIIEKDGNLADRIDLQEAVVLYVTKGGYGQKDEEIRKWKLLDGDFSPFKEFHVKRDDAATDKLVGLATSFQKFKKTGEYPQRICPTRMVPRAKYCRQHTECWK